MLKQKIHTGYQSKEPQTKVLIIGGAIAAVAALGALVLINTIMETIASPAQKQALIDRSKVTFSRTTNDIATAEQNRRLNAIPTSFQGKIINDVKLVNAADKVIALTFDDGPWPETTNEILYILKKNNVKATFFVLGSLVERYPNQVKKIVEDGHSIGNHTWNHPYHFHTEASARKQIEKTAAILNKVAGVKTALFRPPGGYLDNGLSQYAQKRKQVVVMWSADSGDSANTSAQGLLDNVLRPAKAGGIVLMHDGGGDRSKTVWALPNMISGLREQGYRFVTLPELLELSDATASKTKT